MARASGQRGQARLVFPAFLGPAASQNQQVMQWRKSFQGGQSCLDQQMFHFILLRTLSQLGSMSPVAKQGTRKSSKAAHGVNVGQLMMLWGPRR